MSDGASNTTTTDSDSMDAWIVRALQSGEELGLHALLRFHGHRVAWILQHHLGFQQHLIDEILYEATWKAWVSARTFAGNPKSIGPWFLRIAERTGRDIVRRNNREQAKTMVDWSGVIDNRLIYRTDVEQSNDEISPRMLLSNIRRIVAKYPRLEREAVMAFVEAGGPYNSVHTAADLGITMKALRVYQSRGLKRLRKDLLAAGTGTVVKKESLT